MGDASLREGQRFPNYRDLADPLAGPPPRPRLRTTPSSSDHGAPVFTGRGLPDDRLLASTSRYGSPQDLMALVDRLHQREVAILDCRRISPPTTTGSPGSTAPTCSSTPTRARVPP
ncbi:MAG: hypothetical protein R2697_02550 [Ilumatobacteraceae bacterium]